MRRLLLPLLFLLATATGALAGAWPRERGTGFLSTGVQLAWPQNLEHWTSPNPTQQYYTFYLEYGMTDRLTLGLDLGRSVSGAGKTVAFLQWPLLDRESGPKVAVAFGFGQIGDRTVLRPGLSVGWGLQRGWLTMDALAEVQIDTSLTDYKIDFTWGRNLAHDRKVLLQVQTGQPADDPAFVRIVPSYVFPLGRRGIMVETGATYGVTGDSSMGVKFGIWKNF
ncbi:hypothetical protein [Tropicibacter sp. S64]|uniref:hypothetical protein n=1 Tax=Tropicibacter sp. S64 TaxID=3415122 RepID=UPI003C7A063E